MYVAVDIKIYLIRSKTGAWLGAKGKDHWVTNVQEARIYTKKALARGQITWWANNYPEYGIADLIELNVGEGEILSEEQRVKDSINKIQKEKAEQEERNRNWRLEQAKESLKRAQQVIDEFNSTNTVKQ
jgi:hypothetical protein